MSDYTYNISDTMVFSESLFVPSGIYITSDLTITLSDSSENSNVINEPMFIYVSGIDIKNRTINDSMNINFYSYEEDGSIIFLDYIVPSGNESAINIDIKSFDEIVNLSEQGYPPDRTVYSVDGGTIVFLDESYMFDNSKNKETSFYISENTSINKMYFFLDSSILYGYFYGCVRVPVSYDSSFVDDYTVNVKINDGTDINIVIDGNEYIKFEPSRYDSLIKYKIYNNNNSIISSNSDLIIYSDIPDINYYNESYFIESSNLYINGIFYNQYGFDLDKIRCFLLKNYKKNKRFVDLYNFSLENLKIIDGKISLRNSSEGYGICTVDSRINCNWTDFSYISSNENGDRKTISFYFRTFLNGETFYDKDWETSISNVDFGRYLQIKIVFENYIYIDQKINGLLVYDKSYSSGISSSSDFGSNMTDLSGPVVTTAGINGSGNSLVSGISDYYLQQFLGYIYIPEDGDYTFYIKDDDDIEVLIGSQTAVEKYSVNSSWSTGNTLTLEEGYYSFECNFWEATGSAYWYLAWQKPSDSTYDIIDSSYFYYGESYYSAIQYDSPVLEELYVEADIPEFDNYYEFNNTPKSITHSYFDSLDFEFCNTFSHVVYESDSFVYTVEDGYESGTIKDTIDSESNDTLWKTIFSDVVGGSTGGGSSTVNVGYTFYGGLFPEEVYWTIYDSNGDEVTDFTREAWANSEYGTTVTDTWVMSPGDYTIQAYDAFGDGWNDAYLILTDEDGNEILNISDFTSGSGPYEASFTVPGAGGNSPTLVFRASNDTSTIGSESWVELSEDGIIGTSGVTGRYLQWQATFSDGNYMQYISFWEGDGHFILTESDFEDGNFIISQSYNRTWNLFTYFGSSGLSVQYRYSLLANGVSDLENQTFVDLDSSYAPFSAAFVEIQITKDDTDNDYLNNIFISYYSSLSNNLIDSVSGVDNGTYKLIVDIMDKSRSENNPKRIDFGDIIISNEDNITGLYPSIYWEIDSNSRDNMKYIIEIRKTSQDECIEEYVSSDISSYSSINNLTIDSGNISIDEGYSNGYVEFVFGNENNKIWKDVRVICSNDNYIEVYYSLSDDNLSWSDYVLYEYSKIMHNYKYIKVKIIVNNSVYISKIYAEKIESEYIHIVDDNRRYGTIYDITGTSLDSNTYYLYRVVPYNGFIYGEWTDFNMFKTYNNEIPYPSDVFINIIDYNQERFRTTEIDTFNWMFSEDPSTSGIQEQQYARVLLYSSGENFLWDSGKTLTPSGILFIEPSGTGCSYHTNLEEGIWYKYKVKTWDDVGSKNSSDFTGFYDFRSNNIPTPPSGLIIIN